MKALIVSFYLSDCTYRKIADIWHLSLKEKFPPSHIPDVIKIKGKSKTVDFLNVRHDYIDQCTIFEEQSSGMVLYYYWNKRVD